MAVSGAPAASEKEQVLLSAHVSLIGLRKDMLRYALLQLRNQELAEDVVQEALATALTAQARFEGRASVKTWVFAILKNKIIDVLRDNWHKKRIDLAEDAREYNFEELFQENERWQPIEMPAQWGDPQQTLENQQFWEVLNICVEKLPHATRQVFVMRELLGLEVNEICKELTITPSNCWVILHRARMTLRQCLQQHWFGKHHSTERATENLSDK